MLVAFVIGFVWPFLQGMFLSFTQFKTTSKWQWVGIGNYLKAFRDESFTYSFGYTALYAVVSLVLINVLAFFIAYALTQKICGTNLFRTVFFMPNLIGGIVLGYIWSMIFDGVLSAYGESILTNSTWGFWGLIILMCWQQIGYMMIIYIAGLQAVPAGDKTAAGGAWKKGPGSDYVRAIQAALPDLDFIVEDLGFVTPEVRQLQLESGYPSMKVLQFAFDSREESDYLPHTYPVNSVCYIGTHDNMTDAQWLLETEPEDIALAKDYLGLNEEEGFAWGMIRGSMSSVSRLCIIQMQDYLELGAVAEMFREWPGTLRSDHPARSVAANGKYARYLTSNHDLSNIFGEGFPIGKLYDLDAFVLLIGVGYDKNTSLHLADVRATYPGKHNSTEYSAVIENGERVWMQYDTLFVDGEDFAKIGEHLKACIL